MFDALPACDRQTDRQTDTPPIDKKNWDTFDTWAAGCVCVCMWMEGFRRYRARAMPVSRSKPTHNPHLKHQATYVRCWLANTAGPESVTSYITAL